MVRPEAKWSAWDIVTGEFSCKLGSFRTFFVHLTTRTTFTQIDLNFEVACAFIFQSLFQTKNECRTFSWSQLCRNCPLEHVFIRLFSLFMSEVQSSSYEGLLFTSTSSNIWDPCLSRLAYVPGSHRMVMPGFEVVANPPLGSVPPLNEGCWRRYPCCQRGGLFKWVCHS